MLRRNKMKMVKNLTVANIKKYDGFERREDLDFTDDGNRFRGFSYKGMPITTLRSNLDNTTYLSIRVDYLENEFTYNEWMETEEWSLCHKYNGVAEFDMDELIEDLERIIAKVKEMNKKARNEVIEMKDIVKLEVRLNEEIGMAESVINLAKRNFKWYEASEWEMKQMMKYFNNVTRNIENAKSLHLRKMELKEFKIWKEKLEKHGYLKFKEDDYFLVEMEKMLNK